MKKCFYSAIKPALPLGIFFLFLSASVGKAAEIIVFRSWAGHQLKEQEVIILWVFVVFWCYYAFRVTKSFLWIMFGQEFIKIDDRAFHLKKSILSYGKSYPYYFDNIKNMTYEIPKQIAHVHMPHLMAKHKT